MSLLVSCLFVSSDWPGLCLFCCYQPVCCQPTELILGFFFCFILFPILLPQEAQQQIIPHDVESVQQFSHEDPPSQVCSLYLFHLLSVHFVKWLLFGCV